MKQNKFTKKKPVVDIEVSDIPQNTKATVKRLLKRLSNQKGKLILVLLTALLSSAAYALMPLMVGAGIDNLLKALKAYKKGSDILFLVSDALLVPVLMIGAAALATWILSYIQQYIIASVGEKFTLSLRQDISAKIKKLPLRYFDSHKTGDIMSRITNDLEKVSEVLQVGLMQFISSVFTILITAVAMLLLSPGLSLLVLLSVAASTVATKFVSDLSQRYFAQNQAAVGELNGKVEELYTGNRIIKVFNQQSEAIDEVLALSNQQFEANRKAQFANFAIYPAIRIINQLGFVATALVGGYLVLQGQISLGIIQAFLQYENQISEPVTQASYVITSLQAAIAGAERVFTILDEEEEPADAANGYLPPSNGHVSFNQVKFGYSPEKILMHNLNLEVHPNEMIAIVGPTGGGKTTLINLLMRFYDLNGGSISVDGVDISAMPRGELRRRIGMVLQDTWLFEGTIAENIAYGKMDATPEEIKRAARAARCDHFIRTLPNGYDTVISSEASNISQGQMQLLTIARAMLTNPSFMILDEATSSVDTRTEVEIQKAMADLMKDKTSFVIAHRLSTIKNADLILVVKDGDIIERGTHNDLIMQDGFYASLYNSQFEASA
ncbi:ABC transporter ATP-binding protein [Robinsoniella peoriensis]|uniref:ABC transporter ATP-binding protein n=1 Tax=Robinsoniella peoriensis TaxID=180332 RepID=UPI00085C8002|nr:ABC transporter ATP-binding protein [Robinsoniella peoriensis]